MKQLMRNKNFILLYLGQMVSNLGSGINFMGLTLYTLSLEGGLTNIAFLLMMLKLPSVVFGPFAGVLSDKYNRKTLIVVSDIARGLIGIALFYNINLMTFYILIFFMTMFDVLFIPSISGMLPEIVSKEELGDANSVFAGSRHFSKLVGPALGGILATVFGVKTIFFLNGLSFLLSGISEVFITYQSSLLRISFTKFRKTYMDDLREGIIYIGNHYSIRFIILFFAVASITFGALPILYIDYINNILRVSPRMYGVFMSINSLGLIIGSFTTSTLLRRFKEYQVMILGVVISQIILTNPSLVELDNFAD